MPTIRDYFQNIATAIKTKNSEIVTVTPAQMPQAILDIPSGGGGIQFETPLHFDNQNGSLSNDTYYHASTPNNYYSDIYAVIPNHTYILTLGNVFGDRFVVSTFSSDPALLESGTLKGYNINNGRQTFNTTVTKFKITNENTFLCFMKTITGTPNIKSYLIDFTEWS